MAKFESSPQKWGLHRQIKQLLGFRVKRLVTKLQWFQPQQIMKIHHLRLFEFTVTNKQWESPFFHARWCPLVINWFINPINYRYITHKP